MVGELGRELERLGLENFDEENPQLDLEYLGCGLTWIREGLPVGKVTEHVWRKK